MERFLIAYFLVIATISIPKAIGTPQFRGSATALVTPLLVIDYISESPSASIVGGLFLFFGNGLAEKSKLAWLTGLGMVGENKIKEWNDETINRFNPQPNSLSNGWN